MQPPEDLTHIGLLDVHVYVHALLLNGTLCNITLIANLALSIGPSSSCM